VRETPERRGFLRTDHDGFQSLTVTSPVTVADWSAEVDDYWDRGLLGLALDPNFPASPYVYVLYAYDAPIWICYRG
jgi:hypothetical protein